MSDESAALPVPADKRRVGSQWHRVDPGDLQIGHVTAVVVGDRALCITRTADGYGALDNRCPHQGGPLGEGHIEDGWRRWHGPGPGLKLHRYQARASSANRLL